MLFLVTFQVFLLLSFTTTTASISRKKPITTLDTTATRLPLVNNNHRGRFQAQTKSETELMSSITRRRLSSNVVGESKMDLKHIKDEYLAIVGVGTPPKTQTLQIDTGSDYTWVQCQPCDKCYKQPDPIFNPKASTSFTNVSCDDNSPVCNKFDESVRGCDYAGRCTYKIIYGDKSETQGNMALESIKIGGTTVGDIPIGCSHKTNGSLTTSQADGMLGLGGGSLSFVKESSGMLGGVFSYCLDISGGWLGFGSENVPNDNNIMWASLIYNSKKPTFYYIDLVNLTVGGEAVHMGDSFKMNTETGEGGVILDTGTAITRLPKETYEDLRDKFKKRMLNYHVLDKGFGVFDTCYDLQGVNFFGLMQLPNVTFTFLTHNDTLPNPSSIIFTALYHNVMYQVGESNKYCLAFAAAGSGLNIIGNFQQKSIKITIDTVGQRIGFGSIGC